MKKCMHKIEKMPLQTSSIFSHPWQMSQTPFFSSKTFCLVYSDRKPLGVKSSGLAPGVAMPGPRAALTLQMPHPRDWQGGQMPRSSPGWGRWAQLELTDALSSWKLSSTSGSVKFVWISLDRRTRSIRLKVICDANVDLHMRRTELKYKKICMMMYI